MTRPLILGLTGSIGMGKSTVAEMFASAGVPVFDADAVVRSMQGPGGALVDAIEAAFPGSTGPDGVKRDALGEQVFGDKAALARLEAIVHPAVAARRVEFLIEHGGAPMVVFDIPLLFEKGETAVSSGLKASICCCCCGLLGVAICSNAAGSPSSKSSTSGSSRDTPAPVSSLPASPCISISLRMSNLGFFSTFTLRMYTFWRG